MKHSRWFKISILCFAFIPNLTQSGGASIDDTEEFLKLFSMRSPKTITKVLDRTGQTLGVFAEENRIIISYGDLPKSFIDGLVAAEDASFWTHNGVSIKGILRAGKNFIMSLGSKKQGGSTLTMQLVRNVTQKRQKKLNRKIQEIKLALELEKRYSKQQILEQYANEVYFGGGRYGIETAAQYYFATSASRLSIEQSAFLVGLVQSPERYSRMIRSKDPKDRQFVTDRRNYVLSRMVDEGYLKASQFDILKKRPIKTARENMSEEVSAAYAVEEVRKYLYAKYGKDLVLNGGLEITTTLDALWQLAAEDALKHGLQAVDHQLGFRSSSLTKVKNIAQAKYKSWDRYPIKGSQIDGIILGWQGNNLQVKVGPKTFLVPLASMEWAGPNIMKELVKGTAAEFMILDTDGGTILEIALDQDPLVQGALLAVDSMTGEIRAMVGGSDFSKSKFNRTFQAKRQAGSLLKPFIYGAAFELGWSPLSEVQDIPTRFFNTQEFSLGPVQKDGTFAFKPLFASAKVYEPQNYKNDFLGTITVTQALAESRNIPAVRTYTEIGPSKTIDFARRAGIDSPLPLLPSVALGSPEVTLNEMVRSYATLANGGVKSVAPFLILKIKDRQGKILEEVTPAVSEQVIAPTVAGQLTQILQATVRNGTGARASELGWPIAGKTGTTDDYTDGWFIGFSSRITIGTWVGFDEKRTIYRGADGATIALPIWIEFARAVLPTTPREDLKLPEGLVPLTSDSYAKQKGLGDKKGFPKSGSRSEMMIWDPGKQ